MDLRRGKRFELCILFLFFAFLRHVFLLLLPSIQNVIYNILHHSDRKDHGGNLNKILSSPIKMIPLIGDDILIDTEKHEKGVNQAHAYNNYIGQLNFHQE